MIYQNETTIDIPEVDTLTLLFDHEFGHSTEQTPIHAEAHSPAKAITKSHARSLTKSFAHYLRHSYSVGATGPGKDVVVVCSLGQSALACLFYGIIAAGGIYSGASHASTPSELARQVKDGQAKLLVVSKELKDLGLKAAKEAGLEEGCVVLLESSPDIKLGSVDERRVCDFKGKLDWEVITDKKRLEDLTVSILYSSGTTGLPKGVCTSHMNMVAQAVLGAAVTRTVTDKWARAGNPMEKRTLAHIPTAHVAGIQCYFMNPILEGTTTYWMPSFQFDSFIRYAKSLRLTTLFSVPPIWMAVTKHPDVTDHFATLKLAMTGAAPISADVQRDAAKRLGEAHLRQTWGLSETTGSATYVPPDMIDDTGSLGPLFPGVQMRLVDDDGKDVEPGEPGEALVRGSIVTKRYHNNEKVNKEAWTEDGWFITGDILRVENGLVYLVDRKKELIKYKALQVAPAELEGVLASHPQVSDAAVIGVPAAEEGEVPRAYVVRAPGSSISEAELKQFVKERVSAYKQLRGGVIFVDLVPRSPAGKILRKELRERAKNEQKAKAKL